MNQFKVGDKVYIGKTGKWAKVLSLAGTYMGIQKYNIEDETGGGGWIFETDLEKFIEPKYKIGDKFYLYPTLHREGEDNQTCEVVKTSLNKKLGECAYLCFGKHGEVTSFREGDVFPVPPKPVVVEMTIKQLEGLFAKTMSKNGTNAVLKIIK